MADIITLSTDTPSVQYLCKKDKRLAKIISMVGPITYKPYEDGYAFLVHEIIEQMLSIKAGAKIFARLAKMCNGEIIPETIANFNDEELRSIGTSKNKVSYIKSLTEAILEGTLILPDFNAMPDDKVLHELTKIKGIGNWTAKMYLIFVLDRQDILPFEDVAFLQAYKWAYNDDTSQKSVARKCKKWKPYASIASRFMYRALDNGLTKEVFHLYK